MKNTRSADFCADRIDVIKNFAVTTNVVIKRIHCSYVKSASKVTVGILWTSSDNTLYLNQVNL